MMNDTNDESIGTCDAQPRRRMFAFTARRRIARGRIDRCAPVPYLRRSGKGL